MPPFRVVVSDGESVTTFVVPLVRAPIPGETVRLPNGNPVTVDHVISASRDGLAGIVYAEPV